MDYVQTAGLSLQRRGWRASARRFDTDARGIAEVGIRSDSALGPNVAGTGTLHLRGSFNTDPRSDLGDNAEMASDKK